MQNHCYSDTLQCDVVFKTLAGSEVVGVWWVNPAAPSQILHLGQYHLVQDAWYDVGRRSGQLYCADAECLQARPAIGLSAAQLPHVRQLAQQLFANTAVKQHAA